MANPSAAFLVIGDEILSGRTREANIEYLAQRLTECAIDLKEVRIVSDDHALIGAALNPLRRRWHHVFTSGGIGPTHDDITANAVAAAFGVPIDIRPDARALLEERARATNTNLNEARLRMARIPDGAVLIENPVSTAPGFTLGNVHVMAGVPVIFQAMVTSLLPSLTGGNPVLSVTVRINLPEGEIAGPLGELATAHKDISIGSYPFVQDGEFGVHIVMRGPDAGRLDTVANALLVIFPQGIRQ